MRIRSDQTALRTSVKSALAAALLCAASLGTTAANATSFTAACAEQDLKALTMIEEHGVAQDVVAEVLSAAGIAMLQAQVACYDGRESEALAIYHVIGAALATEGGIPGARLGMFLAPGVPPELARAVLRRAWVTDAQIRDFVGLSENSGLFEAPASTVGSRPPEMTDELRNDLARMITRTPAPATR